MNMNNERLEQFNKSLNSPQREAAEYLDGPLLILAGAGSGKTRVLTHRMVNLILQRKAAPDEILAVTFTNKAAKEMESRIFKNLSDLGFFIREPLWISTFHSFCNRILRNHIDLLGYKSFFSIYDDSDQLSLVKKIMQELNISDKTYSPKLFRGRISHAKMLGINPQDVKQNSFFVMDEMTLSVYIHYEKELKKNNALDFDDLLLKTYELLKMYPVVADEFRAKFKYIMIDEYQDTNRIQYLLIQELAKSHRNLCVVGDEDQSIYSWRGADIRNILDFEKDFSEAKTIKLEENYRSSGHIVKVASALIKNNQVRKEKTLFTSKENGDLIQIREEANEYEEARWVVRQIEALVNSASCCHSDVAIFYRTNAQSRVLEEQLRSYSIPYKIVGGVRFYERMEIKDIISYLKLILNQGDDIAFKRVINSPTRGIGKTTLEKLQELANMEGASLWLATQRAIEQRAFNAGTTSKLRNFLLLMEALIKDSKESKLIELYQLILEKSEYVLRLKQENTIESQSRLQNLEELGNAIVQFTSERTEAGLLQFLEDLALASDVDSLKEEINSVTLMTLHVSKGLEYPYVFIVGMEENLFPSARSGGANDSGKDTEMELEEERRLAYVGMTRAEKCLHLTYVKTRKVWGQDQMNLPSRFLKELPNECVNFSSSQALSLSQSSSRSFVNRWKDDFDVQSFPQEEGERGQLGAYPGPNKNKGSQYSENDFKKGMKVRHPSFGFGSILDVDGSGEQQKVSVVFTNHTVKKFVAKFARLEKI